MLVGEKADVCLSVLRKSIVFQFFLLLLFLFVFLSVFYLSLREGGCLSECAKKKQTTRNLFVFCTLHLVFCVCICSEKRLMSV